MYVAKQNAKNCKLIEVFNQNTDIKVGEFYRNYCSFGVETFAPFFREGKWYALYSPSYVAISAMELPSCKHIECEDQNNSFGFCPVEIYIPQYEWSYTPAKSTEELKSYPKENWPWLSKDRYQREYLCPTSEIDNRAPENYYDEIAFVSGCVWGDDSSWKIEIRDISRAHEGIIKNIEDWGYYEQAFGLDLKQCIRIYYGEQHEKLVAPSRHIILNIQKYINLKSDLKIEEHKIT